MIERRPFGRTGHLSSRAVLGAAAFGEATQDEVDSAMEFALARGVNHVDTAPSYGESEVRIGSWIRRHGQDFFLATKTGERTAAGAREEFQHSLERLHVDRVDLLQLHNLVEPDEWELALGPGGALELAVQARAEGLVRFIGITGHGLGVARTHRRALDRFDFDSVLLPYSYLQSRNAAYRADFEELAGECVRRGIAVQTIKSIVRAPWGDRPATRATWYEPIEDQAEIDAAVHWVLGHLTLFLNTAGDIHLLPRVIDAADRFRAAPSAADMQSQVDRLQMAPLFA